MAKWSEAELSALGATAHLPGLEGYRKFLQLTGTDRGFDSWEVKRRRLGLEPSRLRVESPGQIVPMGEFKGLSVGFFDIETTFSTEPIVLYAAIADQFGRIQQFPKGDDITNDRDLVNAYSRALEEYDILVSWNGKLFDVPVLQARLAFYNLPRLNVNMHIDLMYYATGQFARLGRKSLQHVSEYFSTKNSKTPLDVRTWNEAMAGKGDAYDKIVEHCDADVLVLRDTFPVLKRFVRTIHRGG